MRLILYRVSFGLLFNRYGKLHQLGCLHQLKHPEALIGILKEPAVFDGKRFRGKYRRQIFEELCGKDTVCQFSRQTHKPGLGDFTRCSIIYDLVLNSTFLNLNIGEYDEMASFFFSTQENADRLAVFLGITFSSESGDFTEFEARYLATLILRPNELRNEVIASVIQASVVGYEKARQNNARLNPNKKAGNIFYTPLEMKMNGISKLLWLITSENYQLKAEDLLPLAYSANERMRDMALNDFRCSDEARVVASLMSSQRGALV